MKYSFLGISLLSAGVIGVVFIVMFQAITINNESEYYVLKEAMEAAMLESVDVVCYRNDTLEGCGGVVKISEQKFVENFTRRFIASIGGDASQYKLEFYDIMESPPKVSVIVTGKTQEYGIMVTDETDDGSFGILNYLDGILEYDEAPKTEVTLETDLVLNVADPEKKYKSIANNGSSASSGIPAAGD